MSIVPQLPNISSFKQGCDCNPYQHLYELYQSIEERVIEIERRNGLTITTYNLR